MLTARSQPQLRDAEPQGLPASLLPTLQPQSSEDSAAELGQKQPKSIRKGTRSCWECKRRKVRCAFANPQDASCIACSRRSIRCVGQDSPDDAPARNGRPVRSRLGHLENLVEQLTKQLHNEIGPDVTRMESLERQTKKEPRLPRSPRPPLFSHAEAHSSASSKQETELLQVLHDVWPNDHDLDIILQIPVPVSQLFHGIVCSPYSSFFGGQVQSARELPKLPQVGSHPVLVARKLLFLSIFLQNIPLSSSQGLQEMSIGHVNLMNRVFGTATRLVTSNDDLAYSIEGIECIMIESMYYNNAGNLRRAWLGLRRAIGIAQLMNLHKMKVRTDHSLGTSAKMVDPQATRERIDPALMWFRLIASDRYLSLMLGLPEVIDEDEHFASPCALGSCLPVERMERILTVAGGRILRRNRRQQRTPIKYGENDNDITETHEIDQILHDAASSMPPKWWLPPTIPRSDRDHNTLDFGATDIMDDATEFERTLRLMNQMTYFYILVRLHLPYLLHCSSDAKESFEYNRGTAVDASRELLTRYVGFRLSSFDTSDRIETQSHATPSPPYCRGIDFLAFIASMVLCLSGIDSQRHHSRGSSVAFISHQRCGDRGLMEHTLEIMDNLSRSNGDTIATKVASILRALLDIEQEVMGGVSYQFRLLPQFTCNGPEDDETDCGGSMSDEGSLHIHIPHLGIITVQKHCDKPSDDVLLYKPAATSSRELHRSIDHDGQSVIGQWEIGEGGFGTMSSEDLMHADDWDLQGVDMAFFNDLLQGATKAS
ncbi:hypothetical protein F5Y16DRAFT_332718 [Xylariaceae sp. FL0255]|nr:hypothetical protein F5Y16DRAFT_332718 [Xylariaceae sp. FL0255]